MQPEITPEDIRPRRISAGMSTTDLASELDLHAKTIERWETGVSRPSRADLIAIEAVLADKAGAKSSPRTSRKSNKR